MPFALPRRPRFLRRAFIDQPVDAPAIRTARLVLRPHRTADAGEWYAIQSDPQVVRYLRWPVRDRRASLRHLRQRTRHVRLWQADDFLALAVTLDGRLIGDVSLHLRAVGPAFRSAEIGWILDPRFGRRGYATEAADAMLGLAFGALRAKLVFAVVDVRNDRSMALAGRLGFRPAAVDGGRVTFALTAVARRDALRGAGRSSS